MAHRAALYTVRVKRKWSREYRLLGDLDGRAANLGRELESILTGFEEENTEETKIVRCTSVSRNGHEVVLSLQHGENGVVADIVGQTGQHRYHQTSSDTHLLRCGGLFVLPSPEKRGWLALHVNNNRGVKGLLDAGLQTRFSARFSDLSLEIDPYIDAAALQQAVDEDRIASVRLTKLVRPGDRAVAATEKWVRGQQFGQLELKIWSGRGKRLAASPIKRFLSSDGAERGRAFDDIVVFEGMRFDAAKVEVVLPNGTRRTFNIEHLDSGHPMTVDLEDIEYDDDGDPTTASVISALKEVLQPVLN